MNQIIKNNRNQIPSEKEVGRVLDCYNIGQIDEAEKLALLLTKHYPNHQFGWKALSVIYTQVRRLSEALIASKNSINLNFTDAIAHYNLGNILNQLGRLEEAEKSYKQAIAIKPDYIEAYFNLGNTLNSLNKFADAIFAFKKAILLKPDYAEVYNNLGTVLQKLNRNNEAASNYKEAILIKSDFVQAHFNLGNVQKELDQIKEAEVSYKQAIALKPDYAEAYNNLGIIIQQLSKFIDAEDNYIKALEINPNYAEAYFNLGNILHLTNRLILAETNLKTAVMLKPDFAEAHNNLGGVLQDLGRLDEAKSYYIKAVALKPDYAEAHRNITLLKRYKTRDDQLVQMENLFLDKALSKDKLSNIAFGLAKASEDLGELEQAFKYYTKGNNLRKNYLNYKISEDIELFNQLKTSYSQIADNSLKKEEITNKLTPIFIIGMPRSGTTLVEQIISSHSKVTGAGELFFASEFGDVLARGLCKINKHTIIQFRENYLKSLENLANGHSIVIDKMPQNFRYTGLLVAAFPEAKIVHVKRNPAAVSWANYKQFFVSKFIGYCYDLDDIMHYHGLYEDIMDFWTRSFSNKIYNLSYESLTLNQEEETIELIQHLGLDWDKKCLSPENNTRSVTTASNTQIRKKVYQGSSEQWKKFKPFLKGKLDHIEGLIY